MKKSSTPLPPAPLTVVGMADASADTAATCPLFLAPVNAGWPSAAEDYIDGQLNLHELIVRHPSATFFLRAAGDSMLGVGIHDGDLLVVDRSLEASHNRVVIAALDGELLVKKLCRRDGRVLLQPANPDYPEFDITEREYAHIWGVVSHVIHRL
ncbi:MAG: translesion error-prone DNA polymerase V autoproteolytic subunit [Desulfovibrio sp.]|nr:translesion error-prone DNA polymerase V autoproteolytic subunit [Desulfovibrio sp.]